MYMKVILFISISLDIAAALYTEEPTVKLLKVESLADRFPASDSPHRIIVENGFVRTEY